MNSRSGDRVLKLKSAFTATVATASLLAISGVASAAPYKLVSFHQRSGGGALSSLMFKAGAAQGCPGPTYTQPCYSTLASPGGNWAAANGVITDVTNAGLATWDWNGTTLTMTGLLWAASSIGSNPNGTIVISDRITGLTINPGANTTTALTYECREGTFLASVGANGCLNTEFGTNSVNDSSAVYNFAGSANCVVRTLGGDDVDTGNPRGVFSAAAGGGCDAVDGGFDHWEVIANPRFLILANQPSVAGADGCYMFGRAGTATSSPCALDTNVAGASYLILAPDVDTDADGVVDALDNCRLVSNSTQVDSNGDGYGNRCDGDLNNNGATNAQDYVLFRQQLGQPSVAPTYNAADINANGAVNAQDYVLFRGLLGSAPGLSGICLDTYPCPANP